MWSLYQTCDTSLHVLSTEYMLPVLIIVSKKSLQWVHWPKEKTTVKE